VAKKDRSDDVQARRADEDGLAVRAAHLGAAGVRQGLLALVPGLPRVVRGLGNVAEGGNVLLRLVLGLEGLDVDLDLGLLSGLEEEDLLGPVLGQRLPPGADVAHDAPGGKRRLGGADDASVDRAPGDGRPGEVEDRRRELLDLGRVVNGRLGLLLGLAGGRAVVRLGLLGSRGVLVIRVLALAVLVDRDGLLVEQVVALRRVLLLAGVALKVDGVGRGPVARAVGQVKDMVPEDVRRSGSAGFPYRVGSLLSE
jgi:hypothetical protein